MKQQKKLQPVPNIQAGYIWDKNGTGLMIRNNHHSNKSPSTIYQLKTKGDIIKSRKHSQHAAGFVESIHKANEIPISSRNQDVLYNIKSNEKKKEIQQITRRQNRYQSTEAELPSQANMLQQRHYSHNVTQQYKTIKGSERVRVPINSPRLSGNQTYYNQVGAKARNSLASNEEQALQQFKHRTRVTEVEKASNIITTNNKGPGAKHRKTNQFYKLEISQNNDEKDFDDVISLNSAAEGSVDSISKVMNTHTMRDLRIGENVRAPTKTSQNKTLSKVLHGQNHFSQIQRKSIDQIQSIESNVKNNQNKAKKIELVPQKPVFSSFITPSVMANKRLHYQSQQHNLLQHRIGDVSHEVSSEQNSDDEEYILIEQSRYHKVGQEKARVGTKVPEKAFQQSFEEIQLDKCEDANFKTAEKKPLAIAAADGSSPAQLQLTPFQNQLPTPKPMPKPFNPPMLSTSALRKSKGCSNHKKNKDGAICKPLPNPRNVQNQIKQNNIICDSLYSEEDNSENMSSFESSHSIYKKDRSEDRSRHSSTDYNIKSSGKKKGKRGKINRVTESKNRKHLFSNKKDTTYQFKTLEEKPKCDEPIENYDESIESTARVNKIQVSGYSSRQHEGSMNLKSRLTSLTRNTKKIMQNELKYMEASQEDKQGFFLEQSQAMSELQPQQFAAAQKSIDPDLSERVQVDNDIDECICDDIYSSLKKINKIKKKSLCQIDIDQYKSSDEVTKFKKQAFVISKPNNLDRKANEYQTLQDEFNEQYYPKIDKTKISPVYNTRKSVVASKRRLSCSDATPQGKQQSPSKNLMHSATAESCDANLDYEAFNASCEINSVTTNNRKQSLAINRHYFEISMRFKQLKEVPISKIQAHQSLKMLDLSHNNITIIPKGLWQYIPNLTKLTLDYNQIKEIPVQSSRLSRLQACSMTNNKISQFPGHLFNVEKILTIQLGDNLISEIPSQIKEFSNLKQLNLHNNPISQLPIAIEAIWDNLHEFSIDWLSYLFPFVGKMIRLHANIDQSEDTDLETTEPEKKMKQLTQNKSQSFIHGIQNATINSKQAQKEKIKQTFDKFKKMLVLFQKEKKSNFTFTDFLCFYNRKHDSDTKLEIIKKLQYPPKSRGILHQLAEDDKLCLIKQLMSQNPDIDVNSLDDENSTALIISLKNKHLAISRYLIRKHGDQIDILIKSRKLGNAINLAIRSQEFEIIDLILNHKQIQKQDSYILNYIIPNFEKNPTENAKYIVKLILEKGMDPNNLRQKFLNKDLVPKAEQLADLPEKILDISPISLACMKYQNNAFNFIVKFNNTIREIKHLERKIEKQKSDANQFLNARHFMDPDATYHHLINQIDKSKQSRVKKFFTYIEDISKIQNKSKEKIIQENLKLFDFNQLSGPNKMHALHYAVQGNNLKAIEKFKKIQYAENIDFSVRDGLNHELPQEFAAPSAPIYKMVIKIQRNTAERQKITHESYQGPKEIVFESIFDAQQQSIGESYLENCKQYTIGDYAPIKHQNINLKHSKYIKPKFLSYADQLCFDSSVKRYRSQISRPINHGNELLKRKSRQPRKMQYKPYQIEQKGAKYQTSQPRVSQSNVSTKTIKNTPNLSTTRQKSNKQSTHALKAKIVSGNDDTLNQETSMFSYGGNDIHEVDLDKPDTPPMVRNLSYQHNSTVKKKFMVDAR